MDSTNRPRLGILGGSFNPVHMGHLLLAQSALDGFDLAKVLFMPCHIQPLKDPTMLAAPEHRVAMLEHAISDNLQFEVLDIEIARGGPSFAVDSVREIKARYPEADLFFIVGADTLSELHRWYDVYTLLSLCTFATFSRPGQDVLEFSEDDLHLDPPWGAHLLKTVARGRMLDISSSDIRHRVAEGMSIRYLVPPLVEMYITERRLY